MNTATVTEFEVVEIPVKLCKRGRKADAGRLLRETPMAIERVEFTPDNSRIERESRGLQSKPVSILDEAWSLSVHQLAENGIVPLHPIVTLLPATKRFTSRKPYWCESKPSMFGTAVKIEKPARIKSFKAPKYSWL